MTVVALQSSSLEMRSWGLGRWGAPTRPTLSLGSCGICWMGVGRVLEGHGLWCLSVSVAAGSFCFCTHHPFVCKRAMPGWGQPVSCAGVSWAHGTWKGASNTCYSVDFHRNLVFSWIAFFLFISSFLEYLRLLIISKVGPENFSWLINLSFLSTDCQFLFYQSVFLGLCIYIFLLR